MYKPYQLIIHCLLVFVPMAAFQLYIFMLFRTECNCSNTEIQPPPANLFRKHPNPLNLVECPRFSGWNGSSSGYFLHYREALARGAGDYPDVRLDEPVASHTPPRLQKVVVLAKGGSARLITKEPNTLLVTVNHALAWVNESDIHFGLDYYYHHVYKDFFCRAKALVLPTYFHYTGTRFVHASILLSHLNYSGPVFFVQLQDSPYVDPLIETWTGAERLISSGDLAFAWLLRRGYRVFESYGMGGLSYADFFVSENYTTPSGYIESPAVHDAHIRARMTQYGATWTKK